MRVTDTSMGVVMEEEAGGSWPGLERKG